MSEKSIDRWLKVALFFITRVLIPGLEQICRVKWRLRNWFNGESTIGALLDDLFPTDLVSDLPGFLPGEGFACCVACGGNPEFRGVIGIFNSYERYQHLQKTKSHAVCTLTGKERRELHIPWIAFPRLYYLLPFCSKGCYMNFLGFELTHPKGRKDTSFYSLGINMGWWRSL